MNELVWGGSAWHIGGAWHIWLRNEMTDWDRQWDKTWPKPSIGSPKTQNQTHGFETLMVTKGDRWGVGGMD